MNTKFYFKFNDSNVKNLKNYYLIEGDSLKSKATDKTYIVSSGEIIGSDFNPISLIELVNLIFVEGFELIVSCPVYTFESYKIYNNIEKKEPYESYNESIFSGEESTYNGMVYPEDVNHYKIEMKFKIPIDLDILNKKYTLTHLEYDLDKSKFNYNNFTQIEVNSDIIIDAITYVRYINRINCLEKAKNDKKSFCNDSNVLDMIYTNMIKNFSKIK